MIDVSLDAGDFVMTNLAYGLYLGISIAMTVWVARALSSNGEVFLVRCFGQDAELAATDQHAIRRQRAPGGGRPGNEQGGRRERQRGHGPAGG